MVLHVKDQNTDRLAREFAQRRGISITDAIREAVEEALNARTAQSSLWDRTADLRRQVADYPPTGLTVDKAFYDSVSGQEDEA